MTIRSDDISRDFVNALDGVIARGASETLGLPHVVYVYDRESGVPCALGPFRSPVEACVYGERVVREMVGDTGDASSVRIDVASLESRGSGFPKPATANSEASGPEGSSSDSTTTSGIRPEALIVVTSEDKP